jgi:SET domain-containing protein
MKFGDVEIKESTIRQFNDGLGVFALRDFKKGEIVIQYNLQVLTEKEYKALPVKEKQFTHKRDGIIYYYQDPERHVNRCEDPNVYPDFQIGADVALRNIKKGEELSIQKKYKEDF